jgi:hypothetical protein
MTTSIAEYYLDELYDWRSAIDLYLEEIDDSEEWLQSILRFDSVPALAAKVEHHLNQLFLSKENLLKIKSSTQSSEQKFFKDQVPVGNDIVTEELKINHKKLREEMHKVEKEYLDIKYDCDEFLADAVEIQDRTKNGK